MTVTIDPGSGFCFGVVYAIQMAEDELDQGSTLYCLGDIVHNDVEVKRLGAKGLKIINHEDLAKLHNCKVLIRAHGEPPQTYITALENNIELLDASCPVVLKLQNRVKISYDKLLDKKAQIVIYGIPGHAEVNGLMGQTNQKAIIITSEEDLAKINFTLPIVLFSQTTKSTEKFYHLAEIIRQKAASLNNPDVSINDTICRQVSNREPQLQKFSAAHEVIVFVSGKKSSNGKVLYNVCKETNPHSYFISDENELNPAWFSGVSTVGICGATSTPMWLMERVKADIEKKFIVSKVA